MSRSKFIAERLKEVLLSGHWVAQTNIKDQIENTSYTEAIEKVGTLNSIAALTFHLTYYLAGIIHVFEGGDLDIRDKYSFDMPPISSEADWNNLVSDYLLNSKKFIEHIESMPDSKWDEPFADEKYGLLQRNIEGVIEHSYYHLGQITLIKKLINSKG